MKYNPEEYWSKRFEKGLNLGVVGHISLGYEYNKWLYKARILALNRLLKNQKISVERKSVLDIGVGSGFYIDFWERSGAASITGLDITYKSIATLKSKYPQHKFLKSDIGADLGIDEKFDIITCFDILFHIVDEKSFEKAISNIRRLSHEGTYILISDSFLKTPLKPSFHESDRTLERYSKVLGDNCMKIKAVSPIFYLMNTPIDEKALEKSMRPLILGLWDITTRVLFTGANHPRIRSLIGNSAGILLYFCDSVILKFASDGPSTKLLLAEVTKDPDKGDTFLATSEEEY